MNAGGPAGQLIDDRFELLQRLGGGGMGLVWRARDTMLQREVALKEVRVSEQAFMDEDPIVAHVQRERVLREARSLARLHHPNVVTIYHIVDSVGQRHPWLVMELVSGGSLADRLERGPLTPQEAARVGRGVLAALRAAHEAGIQHRDVKPANVLLRPDGTPVLTDFGIAALRETANRTNLTATGALIGSPEYIAPERIRGQEGDPASDLWSLGMLMYVAVEGHNPLRRDTNLATLAAVLDAPIPEPVRCGPLTPALAALLVRDPAARPDEARLDQLLAAAEHSALGMGVSSAPYGQPPGVAGGVVPGAGPGAAQSQSQSPYDSASSSIGGAPYSSTGASYGQAGPAYAPFGVPYGAAPVGDRPPTAVVSTTRRFSRRNTMFVAWVASAASLALVAAVAWTLHGSNGPSTNGAGGQSPSASTSAGSATGGADTSTATATGASGSSSAASQSTGLLTAAGMKSVISAVRAKTGVTKMVELTVYSDYATVQVPTKADATLYDEYLYHSDGTFQDWGHGTVSSDDTAFDPDSYTWSALPTLIQYAKAHLKIPNPTDVYVIVSGNWFGDGPAMAVYLSDDYGGAYLEADARGNVKSVHPRGS